VVDGRLRCSGQIHRAQQYRKEQHDEEGMTKKQV